MAKVPNSVATGPATAVLESTPSLPPAERDDRLNRAKDLAEGICSAVKGQSESGVAQIYDRCRELVGLLTTEIQSRSSQSRIDESAGGSTMTELLATIYTRAWEVVFDRDLRGGSPIRIREVAAPSNERRVREIISSIEEDLERGQPLIGGGGIPVRTDVLVTQQATSEVVNAVFDSLAFGSGRDVFIIPEQSPSPR